MGWHSTYRRSGTSNLEWFRSHLNHPGFEVLEAASKHGVCYLACRVEPSDGSESYVAAMVCLTNWAPSNHYNFSYKAISENMGPAARECPARILELLTPVEELPFGAQGKEWSRVWREACQEKIRSLKQKPKPQKGDLIYMKEAIRFTDKSECQLFEWIGGSKFWQVDETEEGNTIRKQRVHITRWREREFQLAS